MGSARLCSRTRGQQQPSFGVRSVLLVGIVEQWRMATTCSVRQHSAWRCGDNVRRLAAIPRPSPGESMLRLVVHSIAGRRQSEQRSPIALSIAVRALLIRFHTWVSLRWERGNLPKWQIRFWHVPNAAAVLVAGCVPPQAGTQRAASRHGLLASNLRACAPARRGAAAYGSASRRLAEGLILETPLDSVITS